GGLRAAPADGRGAPRPRVDREVPIPPLAGELDRGRHLRGHAQHPRRACARSPGRAAQRQEHSLEGHPPMGFAFTPEHEELRQTVRRFLADKSSMAAVRTTMATDRGFDPAVWSQLSDQLGLPGLIVPEELGGSGMGATELAIVMEEMGRALL